MAASNRIQRRAACAACAAQPAYQTAALRRQIPARLYLRGRADVARPGMSDETRALILRLFEEIGSTVGVQKRLLEKHGIELSLPTIRGVAAAGGHSFTPGGPRANAGGARPNTGGARPGAGRPVGSRNRLPPKRGEERRKPKTGAERKPGSGRRPSPEAAALRDEIIRLHAVEKMKPADIARAVGRSPQYVSQVLSDGE